MDIQLQKTTALEGIINVRIHESDYKYLLEDKLREYAKKAQVKGFRPGHVPISLIRKWHEPSLKFEIISNLTSDALDAYLRENKLNIVVGPFVDAASGQKLAWDKQQEIELQYHTGWVEAYQVDLNKQLELTAYEVNQTAEETLDGIIDQVRKHFAEQPGLELRDIIYGVLLHQQLNHPKISPLGATTIQVLLNSHNSDLMQATDSIDALRAQVKQYVLAYKQQEAKLLFNQTTIRKLLEVTHIALPDDLLKRWIQRQYPEVNDQDLANYYTRHTAALRWGLIMRKIAEDNKITVTANEIMAETKNFFSTTYGIPSNDSALTQVAQEFLQRNEGENYREGYHRLLHEKIFVLIKEQSTFSYQPISLEEFNKLPY